MFAFSLLAVPAFLLLKRSFPSQGQDNAGFLFALIPSLLYCLLLLLFGDIFDRSRPGVIALLHIVLDRGLFPVLLPCLLWLSIRHFSPKSIAIDLTKFCLVFLVLPGIYRSFSGADSGWPLDFVLIPALTIGLVFCLDYCFAMGRTKKGWIGKLFYTLFGLSFFLAGLVLGFAWYNRLFFASLFFMPILAGALWSLYVQFRGMMY